MNEPLVNPDIFKSTPKEVRSSIVNTAHFHAKQAAMHLEQALQWYDIFKPEVAEEYKRTSTQVKELEEKISKWLT